MKTVMGLQKARVFRLFMAMELGERKAFIQHLRRYSRPKRQRLKAGFRFLSQHAAAIEAGQAQAQEWWDAVFEGMAFDLNMFRKHQNKLTTAIMEFWVEQEWFHSPDRYAAALQETSRQLLLLSAFQRHGLASLLPTHFSKLGASILALPEDQEKYGLAHQLRLRQIEHQQTIAPFRPVPQFADAQAALDQQYIIASLKLELANRSLQRRHEAQPELRRLPIVSAMMETLATPTQLMAVYWMLAGLGRDTTPAQGEAGLDLIMEAQTAVAPDAWKDTVYLFLNFAIGRLHGGEDVWRIFILRIYLKLLQLGILQADKVTFKHNFINVIGMAFFWDPPAELARYALEQKALLEQNAEYKNAFKFFECQQLFVKRKFAPSCNCFMKVWFLEGGRDVRYAAGVMLIKTYYELGQYDDLKQFAADFKRIITHDKGLNVSSREAYKQFLRGVQVLCNIRFHGVYASSKQKLRTLQIRVTEERLLIAREWMLVQIELLWK